MSRLEELQEIRKAQKEALEHGVLRETKARQARLGTLYQAIKKWEPQLLKAMQADLGKPPFESYIAELGMVYGEIREAIRCLPKWNRPVRGKTGTASFPSRGYRLPEPMGMALIFSPWNYPVQLTLAPLTAALAAGCPCVLKLSPYSVNTSRVLEAMLEEAFPREEVAVFQGGARENTLLLEQKWDTIWVVMEAASRHLTPVTLELGGKSPVIVDRAADLDLAARRIVWGKLLNSGQTCVAPDYVLVHHSQVEALTRRLLEAVKAFYGREPLQSRDYGRIINEKHFQRLRGLLERAEEEGCRLHRVSPTPWNPETRQIAPTVLTEVTWDSAVMEEELFGPILPVLPYDSLKEAVDRVNSRPRPLALYVFTNRRETARYLLREIPFGGGCVNDTVLHLTAPGLPFGGLGESGMGQYHGKAGFDAFTHYKSVLISSRRVDLPVRYAPYEKFEKLARFLMK